MKNKILPLILLLSIFFIACNSNNLKEKKEYYSNGAIKAKYFMDKKKNIHGKYYEYHKNGKLKAIRNYDKNKIHGLCLEFYLDGKIKSKATIVNSKEIDTTSYFYKTGFLEQYTVYDSKGNQLKDVFFYDNGKLKKIRTYFIGTGEINAYKEFFMTGELNEKTSSFLSFNSPKGDVNTISIKLHGMKYQNYDSVTVNFITDFNYKYSDEAHYLRRLKFYDEKQIEFKTKKSDFVKGKVNILIIAYKMISPQNLFVEEFEAQLKEGEVSKDNLNPINR